MNIDDCRKKLNLPDKLSEEDLFLLFFVMGEAMRLNKLSPAHAMSIVDLMGFFPAEKQIEYIERGLKKGDIA